MAKWIVFFAASNGFLAVLIGAFGAHALKAKLSEPMMTVFHTANQYHFYHTLGMLLIGVLAFQFPEMQGLNRAAFLMGMGILVFSGSLYLLALTEIKWLGAITPMGGLCFIAGWAVLAYAFFMKP